jgi:hypothetical protein
MRVSAHVGGRCVVVWCLDNPCGVSITGSFLIVFNISNTDKEKLKELPEDDLTEDRNML